MDNTRQLVKRGTGRKKCDDLIRNNRNPLEHSPVIRNILKFLSLKDIKNCRLVSTEWNSSAKLPLRARSKILFSNDKKGKEIQSFFPSHFIEVFSDSLQTPFTAFEIEGTDWSSNELNLFFENHQVNIQELKIQGITFSDDKIENFDITPWISKSKIIKANTKYNTKFSIADYKCKLIVPLDILCHTKKLSLKYGNVNFSKETKVSPEILKLEYVKFFLDGNKLQKRLRLNDIVDFSNLKDLKLSVYNSHNTHLILDLSDNATNVNLRTLQLKSVSSDHIILLNWSISRWIVDDLIIHCIALLEKIGLQVRKLKLGFAEIDLFALPSSIENLYLQCIDDNNIINTTVSCSQPISLPNLKYLRLDYAHWGLGISTMYHFRNCQKLTMVHYTSGSKLSLTWNSTWIPNSVKILKLSHGITFYYHPENVNDVLNLDQLILEYFSTKDTKEVKMLLYGKILVKNLVLRCNILNVDDQETFFDLLEYTKPYVTRVYVGSVTWCKRAKRDKQNKRNPLRNHVDKFGEYYVFENMKGLAITRGEFQKAEEPERDYM